MAKKASLIQPPKGFRDYLPAEASQRRFVIERMIEILTRYGYQPLETPALEYAATLEGKYGEAEKLIFKFEDRGGREVALPYDLTVPLARVIAQHGQQLPTPFKRYQIQRSWRAEKPQAGRFREFTQCDFDVVGTSSTIADAEVIAVVNDILESLGFNKFHILFNDRRVLTQMIRESGVKKDQVPAVTRILDKLEKFGEELVIVELTDAGIAKTKIESLMRLLGKRSLLPGEKRQEISLDPIDSVTRNLTLFNIPRKRVLYTPTLSRGLDYYTGMILEATVVGYEAGSVGGGGRYDNLIGIFSGKKIPAVGFSFGLERLIEAMDSQPASPVRPPRTQVLVTVMNEGLKLPSARLASTLRQQGIDAELYLDTSVKLDRQIRYAVRKGIHFVALLGPDELDSGSVTVKTLKTGEQETLPRDDLIRRLKGE